MPPTGHEEMHARLRALFRNMDAYVMLAVDVTHKRLTLTSQKLQDGAQARLKGQ